MNFEGVTSKYRLNRPLTEYEKHNRLSLERPTDKIEPLSQWMLVRINSTFMEVVDKLYSFRGFLFLISGPLFVFLSCMSVIFPISLIQVLRRGTDQPIVATIVASAITIAFITFAFIAFSILTKDAFAYTHYPIRLNRKNRTVYVFRSNKPGGVLKVKWDDVYWVLAICDRTPFAGKYDYEIRGHVMDPDGVTVRDTFSLGQDNGDQDLLRQHWEVFRRYMEGGPGQVPPQQLIPIAERREGFWYGMQRAGFIVSLYWIFWVMTSPMWASIGIARFICMRTSRLPRWPADVEAECAVPPGSEPRKKDTPGRVGDFLTWVYLVAASIAGLSAAGYAFYDMFIETGYFERWIYTLSRDR
jgi:hypothetical protein